MSVVRGAARRRWAVVAAGVALLVAGQAAGPGLASRVEAALPGGDSPGGDSTGTTEAPRALLARALGSADVRYTALADTRGTLGLPDLPRLGGVAKLLGASTRARVWWAGPASWRVDVLSATGERGTYRTGAGLVTWDYERRERVAVVGEPGARLPRADDLLAPQAARRLLAGVGPADAVRALPSTRIAGRVARGVRVAPADPRSTIGHADLWADAATGLPLRLRVVDRAGLDALVSGLTDVRYTAPDPQALAAPDPPGVRDEVRTEPDLAAAVDRFSPWRLPDTLAGLGGTRSLLQGTATYGAGLVRFVVLPLPPRAVTDVLANARSAGATDVPVPDGSAARVTSSLLNAVVARGIDGEHGYLIAGLVGPAVLDRAARQLLAAPPPLRDQTLRDQTLRDQTLRDQS
jgi:hypothetical protein